MTMTISEIFFSFRGRISRRRYWRHAVPVLLAGWLFVGVVALVEATHGNHWGRGSASVAINLFLAWPIIAVSVKRLHDRGYSGWFLFAGLIPLVGQTWLIIELWFFRGRGENRFGPEADTAAHQLSGWRDGAKSVGDTTAFSELFRPRNSYRLALIGAAFLGALLVEDLVRNAMFGIWGHARDGYYIFIQSALTACAFVVAARFASRDLGFIVLFALVHGLLVLLHGLFASALPWLPYFVVLSTEWVAPQLAIDVMLAVGIVAGIRIGGANARGIIGGVMSAYFLIFLMAIVRSYLGPANLPDGVLGFLLQLRLAAVFIFGATALGGLLYVALVASELRLRPDRVSCALSK